MKEDYKMVIKKINIFLGIFLAIFFIIIANQYGSYSGFIKKDFSKSENFVNDYSSDNYFSPYSDYPPADSSTSRWNNFFMKKYWRSSKGCLR